MLLDSGTPYAVASALTRPRYTVLNYSQTANMKAVKNDTELAGFREAYMRDSAAFVRWVRFLVTLNYHALRLTWGSAVGLVGGGDCLEEEARHGVGGCDETGGIQEEDGSL